MIKRIAYIPLVVEVFHYGHLRLIKSARVLSDVLVCGVLSDKCLSKEMNIEFSNFKERSSVIEELKSVDNVIEQKNVDPTDNLKMLHKKYPKSKIILVYGDNWKEIPGADYIYSINGEIVQPEYYKRLSKDTLIDGLKNKKNFEYHTEHFRIGTTEYNNNDNKILSTKGKSLSNLNSVLKKSIIDDFLIFTVDTWNKNKEKVLEDIESRFRRTYDHRIIIRSSTLAEDKFDVSNAGHFRSVQNVKLKRKDIISAIENVISSYDGNLKNEVLIQEQLKDITFSGVVFTRGLEASSPYYVFNYDTSGSTDSVTSGLKGSKIEILRNYETNTSPFKQLLSAIREIEEVIPNTILDIEFGVDSRDNVHIFQVRPLSANVFSHMILDTEVYKSIDSISYDNKTYFSDMAFWNPSEMIGALPKPLDYSLYEYLITNSSWHRALECLGYKKFKKDTKLMEKFCGKPYINLDKSFECLLPNELPKKIKNKLIRFYKNKLRNNPELHDKIEFNVVDNCFTFSLDTDEKRSILSGKEFCLLEESLKNITNEMILNRERFFSDALYSIWLMKSETNRESIADLLHCAKVYGVIPFSRIARMAFVGREILNSLVSKKVIKKVVYEDFMQSISTVANDMQQDISEGNFYKYKHLRENTYDITSLRYEDQNFSLGDVKFKEKEYKDFHIPHRKINRILKRYGLTFSSYDLFDFIKRSIELREFIKFEFTKNLSDALELIAKVGENNKLSREIMSFLTVEEVISMQCGNKFPSKDTKNRMREREINKRISLPSVLFSKEDFYFVRQHKSKPNYITNKTVKGKITDLNENIDDRIVVLERADPGFDWIFSKNIKGLVTCYGGVASHMSIRCAEFGIPAMIGCGKEIFNTIKKSDIILIDCEDEKYEIIS